MSRTRLYRYAAAAGFIVGAAGLIYLISGSRSSTASIGYLYAPFAGAAGAALAAAVLFVLFSLRDLFSRKQKIISAPTALLVVLLALAGAVTVVSVQYNAAYVLADNPHTTPAALEKVHKMKLVFGQLNVHKALAANSATPISVLEALAIEGDDHLTSIVGAHHAATPELLLRIVAGPLVYSRLAGAAQNPRLPREAADRLLSLAPEAAGGKVEYQLYQSFVLARLAKNPVLTDAQFLKLVKLPKPEYFLATSLALSPRTPCKRLLEILSDANEALSGTARAEFHRRCTADKQKTH